MAVGRRDHSRGGDLRQKLLFADIEILHEARRYRAAAGLDAPLPVEEGDLVPAQRKIMGGGCS